MEIRIGHRFKSKSPPHFLWHVKGLRTDSKGLTHARLARTDDPRDTRIIAISALSSDGFYDSLDSEPAKNGHPAPAATLRRLLRGLISTNLYPALVKKMQLLPRL